MRRAPDYPDPPPVEQVHHSPPPPPPTPQRGSTEMEEARRRRQRIAARSRGRQGTLLSGAADQQFEGGQRKRLLGE